MEIRIRATGQVMYESELRSFLKANDGPSFDQLTPEVMEAIGVDPVLEGPQAQPERYQVAYRNGVVQLHGLWYTKYSVADMNAEGIATKDAEQTKSIRAERDRRLAALDWTQGKDIPDSISSPAALARQGLRDVPTQAGFPWEVIWPDA